MSCPFDEDCPAWAENKQRCFYFAYYQGKSKKVTEGICPKEVIDAANQQPRSASPTRGLAFK